MNLSKKIGNKLKDNVEKSKGLILVTPEGPFIKRRNFKEVIEIAVNSGMPRNPEGFKNLESELRRNRQYYLEKNGEVDIGYIIPGFGKFSVPPFAEEKNELIYCNNYLHPKDPLFKYDENITLIENEEKLIARFKRPQEINVSKHALENYIKRQSKRRKTKSPDICTLRYALKNLYEDLQIAQHLIRKNNITQIINHGMKEAEYLGLDEWIYVVEKDGADRTLKTCYPADKRELYKPLKAS